MHGDDDSELDDATIHALRAISPQEIIRNDGVSLGSPLSFSLLLDGRPLS